MHQHHPKLDTLLDAARSTTDFPERIRDYEQAAQIYLQDWASIYLYHPTLILGASARLRGCGAAVVLDRLIRLQGMTLAALRA